MEASTQWSGRIARSVGLVALFYIVPLLGAPERLTDPRIALIAAVFFFVDLVQPSLTKTGRCTTDRDSLKVLMLVATTCQVMPLIEWAYFEPTLSTALPPIAGGVVLIGGAALRVWAILTLGRFFTAHVLLQTEHRLVREGPYRWIRHPSYTGAVMLLLGQAMLLNAPFSLAACALLLSMAYAYRIPVEERMLRDHFGDAFEHYNRQTKRLIPYVW